MALWADAEWVPAGERRRVTIGLSAVFAVLIVGGPLFIAGTWLSRSGGGHPLSLVGFALVVLVVPIAVVTNSYRGINTGTHALLRIFHLSPARWEPQDIVTLEASRSRGPQFFVDPGKLRLQYKRMVFFFPQRPTSKHLGQQWLADKKAQLYLYELEPLTPLPRQYQRGAAMGVPHDITVRVLNRQPVPIAARSRLARRGR